jgi:hypothetical protein
LKASPREPIEISALSPLNENQYEALPRINKRGSEQDRESSSQKEYPSIKFEKPARMPFWIALDEVQDPQVHIFKMRQEKKTTNNNNRIWDPFYELLISLA